MAEFKYFSRYSHLSSMRRGFFDDDFERIKNIDYADFKKFLNKEFNDLKERKEKYLKKVKIATLIIWSIAVLAIILGLVFLQAYIDPLFVLIFIITFATIIHLGVMRRFLWEKTTLHSFQVLMFRNLYRRYKREKPDLVNTSNPFSYLDSKLVSDLYIKLITNEQILSIEEQSIIEKGNEFIGKISFFEGKHSKVESQMIKKQKQLIESPLVKYTQLEEYFYNKDLLNFNLEKFDLTKTNYNELSEIFKKISNKFGVEIEGKDTYLNQIQVAYAKEKLEDISTISGYIYLTAQFEVLEKDAKLTELIFTHPITNFLYKPTESKSVQFCIKCVTANIQDFGKQTFEKGKSNKITCLGKIIRWESETGRLDIYPIAIY